MTEKQWNAIVNTPAYYDAEIRLADGTLTSERTVQNTIEGAQKALQPGWCEPITVLSVARVA